MQIEISTDSHISGRALPGLVRRWTHPALMRFSEHLSHLNVNIMSDDGAMSFDAKRCTLAVSCAGFPPCEVEHQAKTVESAVKGAAQALERLLDGIFSNSSELQEEIPSQVWANPRPLAGHSVTAVTADWAA